MNDPKNPNPKNRRARRAKRSASPTDETTPNPAPDGDGSAEHPTDETSTPTETTDDETTPTPTPDETPDETGDPTGDETGDETGDDETTDPDGLNGCGRALALRLVSKRPRWSTRKERFVWNAPTGTLVVGAETDPTAGPVLVVNRPKHPTETGDALVTDPDDPAGERKIPTPPVTGEHKAPDTMDAGDTIRARFPIPTDPEALAGLVVDMLSAYGVRAISATEHAQRSAKRSATDRASIRKAHEPTLIDYFGRVADDPTGALVVGWSTPNPATDNRSALALVAETARSAGLEPSPGFVRAYRAARSAVDGWTGDPESGEARIVALVSSGLVALADSFPVLVAETRSADDPEPTETETATPADPAPVAVE